MTGAQKRKGDRAEREAAALLTRLLTTGVRRMLGAGRADDVGDMVGVDGWAIQVADWQDIARAVRQKPVDAELQAINGGQQYGAALIRLRGGEFRVVMTPETWARVVTDRPPPLRIDPPLSEPAPLPQNMDPPTPEQVPPL